MARAGRNETCPCGSGRKYKKCCEAKAAQSRTSMMVLVVAGAILLMIVLGFVMRDRDRGPGDGRVWSPEHGHYHAP
jgi:hypothetical protein